VAPASEGTSHAWVGGRIHTGRRLVEALLVENGRVLAAGPSDEIRRQVPTGGEVEELGGRVVVPGLIDAHLHPRAAVLARAGLDLSECRTAASAMGRIAARISEGGDGPIFAYGWNEVPLPASERLNRTLLDRLGTDRPVVLYHPSMHTAVASSSALAEAGLGDASPDPPGGRLGREGGVLDGRLFESALRPLGELERRAFALAGAEVRRWLGDAAALGLTTLSAMSIDPRDLDRLAPFGAPGDSPVRIRAYLPLEGQRELEHPAPEGQGELRRTVGLKVYLDGALGPRTAWLSSPYSDDPRTSGAPGLPTGELAEILADAGAKGYQVAMHAIGDEALRIGLRSVRREGGAAGVRIEHASVTPEGLLPLLVALRVSLAVQPMFRSSDTWLTERLGPERAAWAYAFRSLADLGVPMAGSSDAPVETVDPWAGMAAAIAPRRGLPPGQELSAREALALYTTGGGQVLREPELGSLEPGAYADLVVLEARDLGDAVAQGAAGVQGTYLGGKATYRRPTP
jgi:predicted amidohydrolase YtcJ